MLIVGAGPMAVEHGRAALALGVIPTLLARSEVKARSVADATGLRVNFGDSATWMRVHGVPDKAVVAVGVDALADVTTALVEGGVGSILVEKPGGMSRNELSCLEAAATARGARVFIAYNRRFYASVQTAQERLSRAGGATSLRFDFTELAWRISDLPSPAAVKAAWLYANCTHVIDTAFFLAGEPEILTAQVAGRLDWHQAASRFTGSGRTESGALFSYISDWEAPGRWSIDLRSPMERLLLEPIEGLQTQAARSFSWDAVILADTDGGLKPGILGQMRAFLGGGGAKHLMPLSRQVSRAGQVYDRILAGS